MINQESIQAVRAARQSENLCKPLYETYCFSRIPCTIENLLTGDRQAGLPAAALEGLPTRPDKVILFFIDAFGWRFVERYAEKYPFLKRLFDEGRVSKLTTQFPSTTAVHTTTIHTGQNVGETGVYEWFYYEPLLDRIITPLMFSYAGDKERDTLRSSGINPQTIYPTHTLYQRLKEQGIKSYVFQHREILPSTFSDVMTNGARPRPYKTLTEAMINLTDQVLTEKEKAYFLFYFSDLDTLAHVYGPTSRQFEAEVDLFLTILEKMFHEVLAGKLKNTLFLLTADHGQIEVSPEKTIYLNQFDRTIAPFIQTNQQGQLLVPAGSPRDLFLHIKEEHFEEAQALLMQQLSGRADLYRVYDLIARGYFGPLPVSDTLLKRIGNLLVLPRKYETVGWYEKDRFVQRFNGHHGGMTAEEMETELLAFVYD